MACLYNSTVPRPGDTLVSLLNKWAQAIGSGFGCGAQSEWFSLAAILTQYSGTPRPGDNVSDLWRKIRIALGDTGCYCGDSAFDSARRILDILNPGSFRAGDSIYNILWRILEAVNAAPVPADCCLDFVTEGIFELIDTNECLELIECVS